MSVWEFVFPWTKPPLSLNYRLHRMQEAGIVKDLRGLMHAKARHLPDMSRCIVELEWYVNTRTRRDDENPVSTLKALCDGLVDAEVVPDDTAEFMVKLMPRITYRKKQEGLACIVFRVAELPPAFRPDSVQAVVDRIKQEEGK